MILITHLIVSTSIVIAAYSMVEPSSYSNIVNVIIASIISNIIIDAYGHVEDTGRTRRLELTHSITGVGFISILIGFVLSLVVDMYVLDFLILLIANLSHIVLDAVTSEGVYILKRRVSIGAREYDDVMLNAVTVFLSVLVIMLSLDIRPW